MSTFLFNQGRICLNRVVVARSAARFVSTSPPSNSKGSGHTKTPLHKKSSSSAVPSSGASRKVPLDNAPSSPAPSRVNTTANAAASLKADKSAPTPESPSSSSPADAPSSNVPSPASKLNTNLPTLDFLATAQDETGRTGAKSSSESLSTIERRRRFLGRLGLGMVGLGLIGGWFYQGREWEESEKIPSGGQELGRFGRANARISEAFDYFNKPAWTELLPPPLPPPHQRPYTLLLSIDDLLVTSTWDRENGWRTAKRPGVDYFLGYLSQFYEIVIFTSQIGYTAIPIIEKLDPFTLYISYKLFRESTRFVDGRVTKDLSYLNRDLSKVIAIDTNPDHLHLQPENGIIVPKWKGDLASKGGLVGLIPFLESIAIHRPEDVRPILKAYAGKDIPVEYAKKEAEIKKKHLEEWERSGGSKSVVGGVTLSGLFGSSTPSYGRSAGGPPPTYLEQKRHEAQEFYKSEQAYFKSQEPQMQKFMDEERAKQAKEMSGSLFGMITGQSGPAAMLAKVEAERQEAEEAAAAKQATTT